MRRGMFIALAVAGVMLVVASAVTALVAYVPPGDTLIVATAEAIAAAVGIGITWVGLTQARLAGEYEIGVPRDRRSGAAVAAAPVAELSFACPGCGRTYRAGQQVAGLPFACRACDARFTVPRTAAG